MECGDGGQHLTYTTAPLTKAALLDGPTDVTLYAKSTTTEAELSAKLSIVAPDGTVTKQADGILLGSQRALDSGESWYGSNGSLLKPSHPFTGIAAPGHPGPDDPLRHLAAVQLHQDPGRLPNPAQRQQPTPADFHSAVAPTPQELANLAGGVYTVEHSPQAASFVNLPLTTPSSATPSRDNWGPSS